jgi:hypothetical protein
MNKLYINPKGLLANDLEANPSTLQLTKYDRDVQSHAQKDRLEEQHLRRASEKPLCNIAKVRDVFFGSGLQQKAVSTKQPILPARYRRSTGTYFARSAQLCVMCLILRALLARRTGEYVSATMGYVVAITTNELMAVTYSIHRQPRGLWTMNDPT